MIMRRSRGWPRVAEKVIEVLAGNPHNQTGSASFLEPTKKRFALPRETWQINPAASVTNSTRKCSRVPAQQSERKASYGEQEDFEVRAAQRQPAGSDRAEDGE